MSKYVVSISGNLEEGGARWALEARRIFQFLDKYGYHSLPYYSRWGGDYVMKC